MTRSHQVFEAADEIPLVVAKELLDFIQSNSSPKLIALTGGTLGIELIREFGKIAGENLPVRFLFGDERYVPLDDPDRNEFQGLQAWPGLENYLHRYPSSDRPLDVSRTEFERELTESYGPEPRFDLTILGMGPDGHIASLFPGQHRAGELVIAEPESPKPPSMRLSLSYQALNRSTEVWFVASGQAKAEAVRCAFSGDCDLPVGKVTGLEKTRWFIDLELSREL